MQSDIDTQLDLFAKEKGLPTPYLHIVKDGEVVDMSIKDIFDTEKFTDIKAVTFVSSSRFFFDTIKDFESVQIILGIGDGNVAEAFNKGFFPLLDIETRMNFFKDAPKNIQHKIQQDQFKIRYSKDGNPIHSKFYLLSNATGENRLIIGSANMTKTAFNNTNQYEELLIFDNDPLYHHFRYRFGKILNETVDYIPEKVKKEMNIITDYDSLKEILLDDVINKKIYLKYSEDEMKEIKSIEQLNKEKAENDKQLKEIVEIITRKKRNENAYTLRTPKELLQRQAALRNILTKKHKASLEIDNRTQLEYSESSNYLYIKEQQSNEALGLFSIEQSEKVLYEQLKLVIDFIDTYKTFASNEDSKIILENQSKAFEIIMYGLISPFIWKMKQHYVLEHGNEALRRNFPSFLIIGGLAESGKSFLLKFLTNLLGAGHYYDFPHINKKQTMYGLFETSNVMPLFVDEVQSLFFTSQRFEEIIKHVANSMEGKHPTMIGTTNANNFHTSQQLLSRMYYIKFNHAFDKDLKVAGTEEINRIFTNINNTLFRDFTNKVRSLINNDEKFYDINDVLYGARLIFKDYFKRYTIPLPNWFPEQVFNDYKVSSADTWKAIYSKNRDAFEDKGNELSVDFEKIGVNLRSFTSKERIFLINALPSECIKDDGYYLVLNKISFLNFINENKKSNTLLWYKIKSFFM